MAHKILKLADGTYAFTRRENGEKAWHENETKPVLFNSDDSMSDIEEKSGFAKIRYHVAKGQYMDSRGQLRDTEDSIVSVEYDDKSIVAAVRSGTRDILQPTDYIRVFSNICNELGASLDVAGALDDGMLLFGSALLGTPAKFRNGDKLTQNLYMGDSINSLTPFRASLEGNRTVCWNTLPNLTESLTGKPNAWTYKGSRQYLMTAECIKDIKASFAPMFEAQKRVTEMCDNLLQSKIDFGARPLVQFAAVAANPDLFKKIISFEPDKPEEATISAMELLQPLGYRDLGKTGQVLYPAITDGVGTETSRDTLYGALQGATFLDHVIGNSIRKNADTSPETLFATSMQRQLTGVNNDLKTRALVTALAFQNSGYGA